jgi:hypothetical protein
MRMNQKNPTRAKVAPVILRKIEAVRNQSAVPPASEVAVKM